MLRGLNHHMISDEKLYQVLGARLKKLREGEDGNPRFTQAELAVKVGLERTSITNIEKGNQKVPLHVLYKLCEVLKVDISSVLPPLSEVQEDESAFREISIGDSSAKVTPLAAQIIQSIISSKSSDKGHS